MKKQEFIEKLIDLLEIEDENVTLDTELDDIEEYDSMALLSIIAFVDKNFGKTLKADQLADLTTVHSLIELIGQDKFDN